MTASVEPTATAIETPSEAEWTDWGLLGETGFVWQASEEACRELQPIHGGRIVTRKRISYCGAWEPIEEPTDV